MENQVSVFVNFDRAKPGYSPKESVSGSVYVKANVDCVLKDLTVCFFTLDVETETREGGKDAHPAKDFPLKQGEGKAFPFLFTAPDDPYQWAASREVAQWFVEARAEVTTIVKGEEETDRFEATGSYSIMQRPSEYQQPEARQEGEVRKKAVKQEVTSPGAWVTGILFSLVFWGLVYGGLLLTMNGFSDRTIPEGVRYFGLAVLLGGFFVIGKLYEGLGKGISRFTSTLVMAISLFAFYAFAVG
ncbi:MAG TPA: hypothetical protein VHS96_08490, partial [Bacteroidia bacterium]|nr:hypothetical protein [Bacteroidia bacterium]